MAQQDHREGGQASVANAPIVHAELLNYLLMRDEPASIPLIAEVLGLSTNEVEHELSRLRDSGCELTRESDGAILLARSGLSAWVDYLRWACPLGEVPRFIEVYRQISSTQDGVRRLIAGRGGASDGALVIADEQTAGRGRLGRRWLSPPGACVLVSRAVIARDDGDALSVDRLVLCTAVAIARAIEAVTQPRPLRVTIKWPNDVMIDGRKMAGILVEADPATRSAVIGVGVNVQLDRDDLTATEADAGAISDRMTSLSMLGRRIDRLSVLAEVVRQMDACLASSNMTELVGEWRSRSILLSGRATFSNNGRAVRGEIVDLDAHHGLIVRGDAGELVHLPAATTSVIS